NSGQRVWERQLVGRRAVFQLDDDGLSADGIRAAVQHIANDHAAGKLVVNVDIIGIQDVLDIHHGRDGNTAFVNVAVDSDVRVAVDDTGHDVESRAVDHLRTIWRLYVCAHGGDFAVA